MSDDSIREQAYLVARGVRPLALLETTELDATSALAALTRLERFATVGVTPFVVHRGDGLADCGFAAAPWALDLFRWVIQGSEDLVPEAHRHQILGLLLGYSVEAISRHEADLYGRRLLRPAASPVPAPTSLPSDSADTAGTGHRD